MRLFHCTSCTNAEKIVAEGFRCGAGGLTGGGIYLAESVEDASRKARQQGIVLVCDVELGRVMNVGFNGDASLDLSRLNKMGYDSVRIPRKGAEYCVYEPHRVRIVGQQKDPHYTAYLKSLMAHVASLQGNSDATGLLQSISEIFDGNVIPSLQKMLDEWESLSAQLEWSLERKRHPTVCCDGCNQFPLEGTRYKYALPANHCFKTGDVYPNLSDASVSPTTTSATHVSQMACKATTLSTPSSIPAQRPFTYHRAINRHE